MAAEMTGGLPDEGAEAASAEAISSEANAELPPLATKANDLDALRGAVVDAANVGAGLWVSYLFVLLYLLVAAGSVTHRDLLFESPVRLPFLGVDLPLTGFFVLGPAMFLIVHAYVLLHFVLLANKVTAFDQGLREQIASIDLRTRLRRQLPSNIFVQFLAGPAEIRDGLMGLMLWLIALISLVIGPICLLLFFALQFLPYHEPAITWWQRVAVGIDLVLMWLFWPKIALLRAVVMTDAVATPPLMARAQRILTLLAMVVLSGGSIILLLIIATMPGEALDALLWKRQDSPVAVLAGLRRSLVEGDVNPLTGKSVSLWSNRLVLPDLNVPEQRKLDSEAKIAEVTASASFRGRDMAGAVLIGAVLRKVDFMGTNLRGARLDRADLRDARFECARVLRADHGADAEQFCSDLQEATLDGAQLTGAVLDEAKLQGASFVGAGLRKASLDRAELSRADLDGADLRDASLKSALLDGASMRRTNLGGAALNQAHLEAAVLENALAPGAIFDRAVLRGASLQSAIADGASFGGADLRGANLNGTSFRGASLDAARFEGTRFYGTHFEAATFSETRMQGTLFDDAHLEGALLRHAQLQGANLQRAHLDGTQLLGAFAWRAAIGNLATAQVEQTVTENKEFCTDRNHQDHLCPWTKERFTALVDEAEHEFPNGPLKADALKRIKEALDTDEASPREADSARQWRAAEQASGTKLADLATQWQRIGCEGVGAPYVMTSLITRVNGASVSPFGTDSPYPAQIAAAFLSDQCDGAKGLDNANLTRLRTLAGTPRQAGAARP